MKVLLILSALVLHYIVFVQAQERCPGRPARQNCHSRRDVGMGAFDRYRICLKQRIMWYYNPRIGNCQPLEFKGCGGNGNRYCSLKDCQTNCRQT